MTDRIRAFFTPDSTIIVQLNARLQPIHRGDLEDAIVARINGVVPQLTVVGGGSVVDKEGRILSCGIELIVPKSLLERSLSELATTLDEIAVPRGSFLITPPKRSIKVGRAEGLGVVFPDISSVDFEDERALQHNKDLDRAIADLTAALGTKGRVWSWQILGDGAELAIYGADAETLREIIKVALPREGAFASYRIYPIT